MERMCCFSRPVEHVSSTQIFARLLPGPDEARQALVYSMDVEIAEELAMVLPLPVAAGAGEDAVRFVDLSGYSRFFTDVREAFPKFYAQSRKGGLSLRSPPAPATLVVHDVGDFVASFVPTKDDFGRLDPRFRISPEVLRARPAYDDHGFAVFQLKPRRGLFGLRRKRQTVHPMAFTFPTRRPNALFFPTLHVHDGTIPARAAFDHSLYLQTEDRVLSRTCAFERSGARLGAYVDASRAAGLVDGDAVAFRHTLLGHLPNEDTWLEAPRCRGEEVLAGGGELFRFRLSATAAYYADVGEARARRWHAVATARLDDLHDGLAAGLASLASTRRDEWGLVPCDEANAVWFAVQTEDVEMQHVALAFERRPEGERRREIEAALADVIARAVA